MKRQFVAKLLLPISMLVFSIHSHSKPAKTIPKNNTVASQCASCHTNRLSKDLSIKELCKDSNHSDLSVCQPKKNNGNQN